eukprot:gene13859-18586_t
MVDVLLKPNTNSLHISTVFSRLSNLFLFLSTIVVIEYILYLIRFEFTNKISLAQDCKSYNLLSSNIENFPYQPSISSMLNFLRSYLDCDNGNFLIRGLVSTFASGVIHVFIYKAFKSYDIQILLLLQIILSAYYIICIGIVDEWGFQLVMAGKLAQFMPILIIGCELVNNSLNQLDYKRSVTHYYHRLTPCDSVSTSPSTSPDESIHEDIPQIFNDSKKSLESHSIKESNNTTNQSPTSEQDSFDADAVGMRYVIGNIAHDLKTPLTAFLNGLELVLAQLNEIEYGLYEMFKDDFETNSRCSLKEIAFNTTNESIIERSVNETSSHSTDAVSNLLLRVVVEDFGIGISDGMVPTLFKLTNQNSRINDKLSESTRSMSLSTSFGNDGRLSSRISFRIIIAEDSLPIQKMITMLLRKHGHTVVAVDNGADLLEKLMQKDAVILSSRSNSTKMISYSESESVDDYGCSANSDSDTIREAFEAGVDDFLPKPFTLKSFEEIVWNYFSKSNNNNSISSIELNKQKLNIPL